MQPLKSGLYIHIPLCHSKCYYCDFYSQPVGADKASVSHRLANAIVRELRLREPQYGIPDSWNTLYIGGGTPSLLPHECLAYILHSIHNLDKTTEITVEANPEDVSQQWLDSIKSLGINRVSMGIQTFRDDELMAIGRRHDSLSAHKALQLIAMNFVNYSVDLIYGLPGQTIESWRYNVDTLMSLRVPHFSAYLLGIEPGTRLYARLKTGKIHEVAENLVEQMYAYLCETASSQGYNHYEISNFALPGFEAIHNSSYWDGTPYLGLGPSAHSFTGSVREVNPSSLKDYLSKIENGEAACFVEEETEVEKINDCIITSLRTSRGLDLNTLDSFDSKESDIVRREIDRMLNTGTLITASDNRVRIPEDKWLVSDDILRHLIIV